MRLRIVATSDLHTQIYPWDYLADSPSPGRGLARTASLIAKARAEVKNCLLLDNGDFLQGSPLGDLIAADRTRDRPHPMVEVMNHLDYDAVTLGNHEFSHGLPLLNRALHDLACPVVSANVHRLPQNTPFVAPFVVLAKSLATEGHDLPIKIGIIGFAPPDLVHWDHQHLANRVATEDILTAARREVPKLIAAGAELVIALSHSGIEQGKPHLDAENASRALACIPGIDVVVAGHTHQVFPSPVFEATPGVEPLAGTLNGKPAVMPGFFGSHLGVIDLDLTRQNGSWKITRHASALWPVAERRADGSLAGLVPSDPEIEAIAAADHAATVTWARQRIGHNTAPLHSYFSLIRACPSVRVVACAQADYVTRALAQTPFAALPVLSAVAPFRAGGRGGPENFSFLRVGDLQMRHVSDLYVHPNTLTAIEISGWELRLWLERGANIFRQIVPGQLDQPLIDPDFPSFNFDSIEGVTYRIDLAQPPHRTVPGVTDGQVPQRIVDLNYNGKPVAPDARFVLATNSYRTGGSGDFPGASPERIIFASGKLNSDVLRDYIIGRGGVRTPTEANWQFVPMPGTSVTFDTAPHAAGFSARLPDLTVEPVRMTPEGFLLFRLHL